MVSKLLERLVAKQLVVYLRDNGLLPDLQLAYLSHRSTKTAVLLTVLSDILMVFDSGINLADLMILDIAAAFDDHATLLQRL